MTILDILKCSLPGYIGIMAVMAVIFWVPELYNKHKMGWKVWWELAGFTTAAYATVIGGVIVLNLKWVVFLTNHLERNY